MIGNEDLISDPYENRYFSANNRDSMVNQLCDNRRAFEQCVKRFSLA